MTALPDMRAAIELCQRFEGIEDGDPTTATLDPYLDLAAVATIAWGHAIRGPDGRLLRGPEGLRLARTLYPRGLTLAEARVLLLDDLRPRALHVATLVRVPLTDLQFNALVSFEFNLGVLASSGLLARVNGGALADAPAAFMTWCKAAGVRQPGLVRRRACEAAVFAGEVTVATALVAHEDTAMQARVQPLLAADAVWLGALIAQGTGAADGAS